MMFRAWTGFVLGLAAGVLRQLDDALSQCTSDRVVAARSDPERDQRHLKGNTHLTDRFAVKLVTVEVRSDGHGWALMRLKFHSTNLWIEKSAIRCNR